MADLAAMCRGVSSRASEPSTHAPFSSRYATTAVLPARTAQCSGRLPSAGQKARRAVPVVCPENIPAGSVESRGADGTWVLGVELDATAPQEADHLQPPVAARVVQRAHATLVGGQRVGALLQQRLDLQGATAGYSG